MAMLATVLLHILFLMPMAKSELLGSFCGASISGNSISISSYQANLKLLSAVLTKNASSAEFLFAKGSVGSGWQVMYGLAFCFGETTASQCRDCTDIAFKSAQELCGFNMDATVIDDMCLVRFSYANFIDSYDYKEITYGVINIMNTTAKMSKALFPGWDPGNPSRITRVMKKLLLDTYRTAAYNSKRRYLTGFMDATSTMPPLYSTVQCTPDLTPGDCMTCLQHIGDVAMARFAGQQAGRILSLRCSLRYDTTQFSSDIYLWRIEPPADDPEPPSATANLKHRRSVSRSLVIVTTVPLLVSFFILVILFPFIRRHRKRQVSEKNTRMKAKEDEELVWGLGGSSEFVIYDFAQVTKATGNFSERNKLGKGGFGPVYKGHFSDGLEIAVKRLGAQSVQGFTEFRNEIQLIAKLQHTNLVRLLGCCSHGEEKILIYEYLPNKSLDFFIFDPVRKYIINWRKRLAIIEGVAEGLLYLHKHSRLRVIHRDLKASNILLDRKMNPKISDFGLARICSANESEGNTGRIAGTYGYMAPEYASEGIFSIKSDVFSFGVLLLEIVSGNRTSSVHRYGDFINLLGHSWKLWKDGLWLQLVDASIDTECHSLEVMRCINIALLCVQENAADRPTMSDVVQMLSSESLILPEPKHPAYFHVRMTNDEASRVVVPSSVNDITVSALDGR